jgi:hypothetical protein
MRHRLRASLVLCSLLVGGTLLQAARPYQQAATAAPAAATLANAADQEFTADGVTLRYRDVGTGDPIIFIHGYTATLESMVGVANALPPTYRKVALDARGFGRSTRSAIRRASARTWWMTSCGSWITCRSSARTWSDIRWAR